MLTHSLSQIVSGLLFTLALNTSISFQASLCVLITHSYYRSQSSTVPSSSRPKAGIETIFPFTE
jgi:hypothetical protein